MTHYGTPQRHNRRQRPPTQSCSAARMLHCWAPEPTLRQSSGVACTDAETMYVASLLSGSCCWYTVTPFICLKVVQSSQLRLSGRALEEVWMGSWLVSDTPSTLLHTSHSADLATFLSEGQAKAGCRSCDMHNKSSKTQLLTSGGKGNLV